MDSTAGVIITTTSSIIREPCKVSVQPIESRVCNPRPDNSDKCTTLQQPVFAASKQALSNTVFVYAYLSLFLSSVSLPPSLPPSPSPSLLFPPFLPSVSLSFPPSPPPSLPSTVLAPSLPPSSLSYLVGAREYMVI